MQQLEKNTRRVRQKSNTDIYKLQISKQTNMQLLYGAAEEKGRLPCEL